MVFTLQAGYLKKGSGNTDIKTINVKAEANTSLISIDSNYNAHISFNGATGTREIRCNKATNNKTTTFTFGYYSTKATTTTLSQIYKLVDSSDTKISTTLSFNTNETEFSVEKKSEASFTAPMATVKDADGKVVEGAKITYASSNSNIT